MTTIAGIVHNGVAHIGADSQVSAGWRKVSSALPKVFRTGKFIVGACGDVRFADILRHHFIPPGQAEDTADRDYIVTVVVDHIRQRCKDLGHSRVSLNQESAEGHFLLVYKRRIYDVAGDFSVVQVAADAQGDELYACGSGYAFALGSLAVPTGLPPQERIKQAIQIAASLDLYTSGDVTVLSSEG